jgi:hypothetical protein
MQGNKQPLLADAASPEKCHFSRQHFNESVYRVATTKIKLDNPYHMMTAEGRFFGISVKFIRSAKDYHQYLAYRIRGSRICTVSDTSTLERRWTNSHCIGRVMLSLLVFYFEVRFTHDGHHRKVRFTNDSHHRKVRFTNDGHRWEVRFFFADLPEHYKE